MAKKGLEVDEAAPQLKKDFAETARGLGRAEDDGSSAMERILKVGEGK